MKISILFTLVLFLSACGGGSSSSDSSPDENDNTPDTSEDVNTDVTDNDNNNNDDDTTPPTNTSGTYDLTEYLFHDNLDVVGGSISYAIESYDRTTGEQLYGGIEVTEEFFKQDANTVVQRADSSSEPTHTYEIKPTTIIETVHGADDTTRTQTRFVSVGDTYLDADYLSSFGDNSIDQNATCTVLDHLDSFNLATATGSFNLASGTYNDVLKVHCVTSFITNGTYSPHTDLEHYFAKDIGIIFNAGEVILLGDAYIIPRF